MRHLAATKVTSQARSSSTDRSSNYEAPLIKHKCRHKLLSTFHRTGYSALDAGTLEYLSTLRALVFYRLDRSLAYFDLVFRSYRILGSQCDLVTSALYLLFHSF